MSPTRTNYHACKATCADWRSCTRETTARGRAQLELDFVVDEDGTGRGFGGTLRFTKGGANTKVVMFHKGGAGVEYVDDDVPEKVEAAGGIAVEPKWISEPEAGVGWFSRPFMMSRLERNLFGVSARPAAVFKWIFSELARGTFSTVGCSGGSIATYYPRHWYGLDPVLKYQMLAGGPVMSKIQAGCGAGPRTRGRCAREPEKECSLDRECGGAEGSCSPYAWRRPDIVMTAVRGTIDHLHAAQTNGSADCDDGNAQAAFDASDFDNAAHPFDLQNEHPIDFMMNVGVTLADDYLNVLASGAAVYGSLKGTKSWTVQDTGIHCDALKTDAAWNRIKAGAGL
jgi:hypothetical protein